MKAQHVQNRLDKRGTVRCQASCLGWVVRTNPGKPKLMACAACNALHPARLQITDKMVKLLPVAHEGLGRISAQARRSRIERQTTRHVVVLPLDANALCGRALGRTLGGRRTHMGSYASSSATCAECIRLNAMTPAERDVERQVTSAALRVKFADKREQVVRERNERATATEAAIVVARDEARVAMDIMEEVGFDRVRLVIDVMTHDKDSALSTRAEGRAMFVENVLKMAVTAHRHGNPESRGERRWLFRRQQRAVNAAIVGIGHSDVACRFCAKVLMRAQTIGNDYTVATDDHTVRCALEYLAGKLPENLSGDDEVVRR